MRKIGYIVMLSIAAGLAWNWLAGKKSVWVYQHYRSAATDNSASSADIGFEELLKKIVSHEPILVDARSSQEFESGHIPDAWNLPTDISDANFLGVLNKIRSDPHQIIVVYCGGVSCDDGDRIVARLQKANLGKQLFIYRGGWEEWEASYVR